MGYAVVHMMKIKMGGLRGIQSHNNREKPPRTNPDIDMSRTSENYCLVSCDNYRQAVSQTVKAFASKTRTIRKDAVVCCNFIVTSDEQTIKSMSLEQQRAFFEDSVKWFSDRYGKENIVNATVHMDEITPHLHIGIVPITSDGRLCAKDLFNKREMSAIQTEFVRDVGAAYGLERGKEGSERTHLSEQRFKAETAYQELVEIKGKMKAMLSESNKIASEGQKAADRVKVLQNKEKALQGQIKALEGHLKASQLNMQEILKINPEKGLMGSIKGVTVEEVENLKQTAIMAVSASDEARRLSIEFARLSNKYKALEKQIPSVKERMQIEKDRERLKQLENIFASLPDALRDELLNSHREKLKREIER